MRCIATLQTPTSGSILFQTASTSSGKPEKLRQVLGYLPQDFGVYPRVTAYDMLDHMAVLKRRDAPPPSGARPSRRSSTRSICGMCARKAIAGFFRRHASTLRYRGRALIGRPSLLIVDEPTAGLDPEERNRFLKPAVRSRRADRGDPLKRISSTMSPIYARAWRSSPTDGSWGTGAPDEMTALAEGAHLEESHRQGQRARILSPEVCRDLDTARGRGRPPFTSSPTRIPAMASCPWKRGWKTSIFLEP